MQLYPCPCYYTSSCKNKGRVATKGAEANFARYKTLAIPSLRTTSPTKTENGVRDSGGFSLSYIYDPRIITFLPFLSAT